MTPPLISPHALVETDRLGRDVRIGPFAVIARGVVLGDGVVIHPHVVIGEGVELGAGVEVFPGAFIGKEPKGAGATVRVPQFEQRIVIGANCSIGPHAVIFYDVVIGESTLLGDGASVREQCRIGSRCIISRYVTINYNTRIGDRTKVMDMTHITGNCVIGNDVFVSTMVGTTNDNLIGRSGYEEGRIQGPTIEDGAVVGAGSVATRDVPPGETVMGIPARPRPAKST